MSVPNFPISRRRDTCVHGAPAHQSAAAIRRGRPLLGETRTHFLRWPAGQIAILHREVVERRGWLDEREFTRALNFCMLLPGPEALQLAIFLGWKLHGTRGGLVAGLGFILPAVLLLFAFSYVYVAHGSLPWVSALLYGLQAAVVALVLQAMTRIARRALQSSLHLTLALLSFLALEFAHVPFPIVLLIAAAVGAYLARHATSSEAPMSSAAPVGAGQTAGWLPSVSRSG
ncbi:MAG: chromate transporter [Proteobacteria bacterium]|nr:chromate transporter [Pseudomonadota bacterium]